MNPKMFEGVKKDMEDKFPNIKCRGNFVGFDVDGEALVLEQDKLVLLSKASQRADGKHMGAQILVAAEGVSKEAATAFMEYLAFSVGAAIKVQGEQDAGAGGGEVQVASPAGSPAPTHNGATTTH